PVAESHPSRRSLSRRCGEYHTPVLALKQPAAVPITSLVDRDRLGRTARILRTSRVLRRRAFALERAIAARAGARSFLQCRSAPRRSAAFGAGLLWEAVPPVRAGALAPVRQPIHRRG